jgi:hypothetical protein
MPQILAKAHRTPWANQSKVLIHIGSTKSMVDMANISRQGARDAYKYVVIHHRRAPSLSGFRGIDVLSTCEIEPEFPIQISTLKEERASLLNEIVGPRTRSRGNKYRAVLYTTHFPMCRNQS